MGNSFSILEVARLEREDQDGGEDQEALPEIHWNSRSFMDSQ